MAYTPVRLTHCAHCAAPVRRGRRVYCSDECAALADLARRARDRATARALAPRHGYCADCGAIVHAGGVRGPLPQRCARHRATRRTRKRRRTPEGEDQGQRG